MPNALANESSPYLRQHADNPVNWYPWGPETLSAAREQNKPIFLSVGYAACHWCHVMAHESFEDPATAVLMNEHFINIKVDREERPDLDQIYMNAVVALTGHGGWPMSVWLTPAGQPFYGGTYYPPQPRYGMPSFPQIIAAINEAWTHRHEQILQQATELSTALSRDLLPELQAQAPETLNPALFDDVMAGLWKQFDAKLGGWGGAPKFPQPMLIEFLLRIRHRTGNPLALQMAETTLQRMANGGLFDQLGGGFHRYAVDDRFLVPHFEKMLYDNAQLARVYLHAYQLTENPFYRQVTEAILDYLLRDMQAPTGGFYASEDADSEGVEGKFYVWSSTETESILGAELAALFNAAYDITRAGNFEGHNIPQRIKTADQLTEQFNTTPQTVTEQLATARQQLLAARNQRIRPGLDDKIITSWNGLTIAALAEAARVLNRPDYLAAAEKAAHFCLTTLRTPSGRLYRAALGDTPPKLAGYLTDHANLAEGLLELYFTTFNSDYFTTAEQLAEIILNHFADPAAPGFFDTADDHETLIVRPRNLQDNATPSGASVAVDLMLKLALLTGNASYHTPAAAALTVMQPLMQQAPSGFARWLQTADFVLAQPVEIAIVGQPTDPTVWSLLEIVQQPYRPYQVVAVGTQAPPALLADRPAINGQATAYVCRNFTCQLPVTTPTELANQLAAG